MFKASPTLNVMRFSLKLILVLVLVSACSSPNAAVDPIVSPPPGEARIEPPPLLRDHDHDHKPWDLPTEYPDRIAVTWSDNPATSFSVTWRTSTDVSEAFAEITIAKASPDLSASSDTVLALTETVDLSFVKDEHMEANFHRVTFFGLQSDTLYAYRLGDGTNWSSWYQTRTASQEAEPFKFIYFGDAQNGLHSHWARNIRMAYTIASDARFIVHAGDLVNIAHRDTEWGEWFEAAGWISGTLPAIPIPGNHEYQPYEGSIGIPKLSALWRPQFTLPMNGVEGLEETTFYIDYQGVRIVGLNSNVKLDDQAPWLDEVLTNNPHKWALLTFHHPVFSSAGDRDNPKLRNLWKPIIDKHNVDLVMQGHDHSYARGRSINTGKGSNSRSPEGTVYVNSVSGSKMYRVSRDLWKDKNAEMERAAENTQLFQVIEIDNDTLRYQAFTATGLLYDAFDIVKQQQAPNLFIERSDQLGPERLENR